jgi:hypothetical protein
VEVPRVARQDDDAAGPISLEVSCRESIAQADVEDTRNDRVNSILRVPVRHKFHARGCLDSNRVRTGLGGLSNKHRQSRRRRNRRERLPIDIFRENRFEIVFAWLVVLIIAALRYLGSLGGIWRNWQVKQSCTSTLAGLPSSN